MTGPSSRVDGSGRGELLTTLADRPLGPVFESRFEVLGQPVHLLVVRGSADQLEEGRVRVAELLALWRGPEGELDRVASGDGRPVRVAAETLLLAELSRRADAQAPRERAGAPWPARLLFAGATAVVDLPRPAVRLLRVIDRALAADLVARDLVEAGALGACVRVGDDARLLDVPPRVDGWRVEVLDAAGHPRQLLIREGGVSTRGSERARTTRTAETAWRAALAADAADQAGGTEPSSS